MSAVEDGYVCELCDSERPGAYRLPDGTVLCKSHAFDVWRESGKGGDHSDVEYIEGIQR